MADKRLCYLKVTLRDYTTKDVDVSAFELVPVSDAFIFRFKVLKDSELSDILMDSEKILRFDIFYNESMKFTKFVEGGNIVIAAVNNETDTHITYEIQIRKS